MQKTRLTEDQILDKSTVERFWNNVEICDLNDCWNWHGPKKPSGYGTFFVCRDKSKAGDKYGKYGQVMMLNAHKFSYIVSHGMLDDGMVVRHTCDNPSCCNPNHLISGTMKDNVADAIERGLFNPSVSGSKSKNATKLRNTQNRRLTEFQINEIISLRADGVSMEQLSADYKISQSCINAIFKGISYRDVAIVVDISNLYHAGIRFPYYPNQNNIHPMLQKVVESARMFINEALERQRVIVSQAQAQVLIDELFDK